MLVETKDRSVCIEKLVPEMCTAVLRVANLLGVRNIPMIITSGNDGIHKAHSARHPRSLHYEDRAVDFRLPGRWSGAGWNAASNPGVDTAVKVAASSLLGVEYDLVLETDHFHLEYDPK